MPYAPPTSHPLTFYQQNVNMKYAIYIDVLNSVLLITLVELLAWNISILMHFSILFWNELLIYIYKEISDKINKYICKYESCICFYMKELKIYKMNIRWKNKKKIRDISDKNNIIKPTNLSSDKKKIKEINKTTEKLWKIMIL